MMYRHNDFSYKYKCILQKICINKIKRVPSLFDFSWIETEQEFFLIFSFKQWVS